MFGKSKIAALVAEFFGTFVLSLAVLSVAQSVNIPFFSALAAGLTLGLMTLTIGSASGAHLNPAVTLGLWTMRKVQTAQAAVYIAMQLLGGLVAWRVGERLMDTPLEHIATWGLDTRVLLAEMLGAFVFTFGVAAAVYSLYEGKKLATVVGGSLALGIVLAALGSNGIVNPAVAIGLNSISWAYIMGPLLGGVIGMYVYSLLFAPAPVKKTVRKKR